MNLEYDKETLLIRLNGNIDINLINNLIPLIKNNNIRNIVINIT